MFQKPLLLFSTWREYFYSQPTHFSSQQKRQEITKVSLLLQDLECIIVTGSRPNVVYFKSLRFFADLLYSKRPVTPKLKYIIQGEYQIDFMELLFMSSHSVFTKIIFPSTIKKWNKTFCNPKKQITLMKVCLLYSIVLETLD